MADLHIAKINTTGIDLVLQVPITRETTMVAEDHTTTTEEEALTEVEPRRIVFLEEETT